MNTTPLIVVLALLLIILTGNFLPVLKTVGWVIAGLLALLIVILWLGNLWEKLVSMVRPNGKTAKIRELERQIVHRQSLGYEASELKEELRELVEG